jgi:type I restriction enzyme S subunit
MKNGWQTKTLGEVATLQRGFDLPTQDRVGGVYPLVSSSGISDTHHKSAVRGPGVVTGRSGSIGNVFFIEDDFWPLNTVLYIKDFHGNDPRFVFHLLNHFDLKRFATGTGVPTLNRNFVHDELVLVPTSVTEQQRLVGLLDEAFTGIATAQANAEKNLQNARALFESHLQSVFTQRGKGWVDRQLASLCHEITVGHVGPMKTEYKPSGVPFLRSQNIRPFQVSMENAMFIDEAFHRALKKSQLRPGDLAIVRTGYPGTAAVIPPELPDSNCSDVVIVRPSKEVNPHFLAAFFNSAFGKQLVLGKIVGAAQKHFNITAAKEVMLHVPPMPEQRAIIAMVDSLREETQRLASLYERKLAALEALKKSLLHQAFTGEL